MDLPPFGSYGLSMRRLAGAATVGALSAALLSGCWLTAGFPHGHLR